MASKVEHIATIRVPVYAAWKCSKCNTVNANEGVIQCIGATTSYSFKTSNLEADKQEAMNQAEAEWKSNALKLMTNPREYEYLRRDLLFGKIKCKSCGKQPIWNKKGTLLRILMMLSMPLGLIFAYLAISVKTNIVLWVLLAACIGIVVYAIMEDKTFENKVRNLPDKYSPVIGTMNEELLAYANAHGKKVPTVDECIAIASGSHTNEP